MFMHENVKHFTVALTDSPVYSLSVYFQEIALRMPRITHLDLRFSFSVKRMESAVCRLIEGLPRLQTVTMPKYTLTDKIIEALSHKEYLKVAQFEWLESQGSGSRHDISYWNPELSEGAFPDLIDLSLNVDLPKMSEFMARTFFPTHLNLLYLHVTHPTTPEQLQPFLSLAADTLPHLAQLSLDRGEDPRLFQFRADPPEDELVTWDTLRPILRFAQLTTFELSWFPAPVLHDADLEELAQSWPTLERLSFLSELPSPRPLSLTMRALVPFARHCPHLISLGLLVDATEGAADISSPSSLSTLLAPAPTTAGTESLTPVGFPVLSTLHFGISPLDAPESVALFLSRLCPAETQVLSGVHWPRDISGVLEAAASEADAAELTLLLNAADASCVHWAEVHRVLPLLVRLRAEERATRTALESEVEDLRVRCRVLEERLCMGQAGALVDKGCVLL